MNELAPRAACCGGRALTIGDYIELGMRRARRTTLPPDGAESRDENGHVARFSVQVADGIVTNIGFRASACATLVAYCEVAAQRASGQPVRSAVLGLRPADLVRALPAVPPTKRDRARLAARALLEALLEIAKDRPV
jgi:NifU-like protein involved in Fe-S cluster formation